MDVPEKPDPAILRASDADRDRVADLLREALAEGRISPEEHAERLDQVYTAKTYAELAPITADLPGSGTRPATAPRVAGDLPAPEHPGPSIVAIFSGAERKGRWLVDPHINVVAVMGGVDLDFREAVLAQREVTVNVSCVMGGIEMKVPPGVRVINSVAAILGGVDVSDSVPDDPNAPVIRLTGFTLLGGVEVRHRLPKDQARALKEERREYRRHERDLRRERLRDLRDARREARRGLH